MGIADTIGQATTDTLKSLVPADTHEFKKISELVGQYKDWNATIAKAIIFAESGGKVDAQHTNSDGSIDRGLMQINSVHSQYDAKRLLSDPAYNIMAGHEIWLAAGKSFRPWTTYQSGAYIKWMNKDAEIRAGDTGILDAPSEIKASTGIDISNPLLPIANVVKALADPSTYLRLGKGALGGTFIILGVGGIVFIIANRAAPPPVKAAIKVAESI